MFLQNPKLQILESLAKNGVGFDQAGLSLLFMKEQSHIYISFNFEH